MSQFKQFFVFFNSIYFLCSIMNKTWVYEIWISLHSVLIYILYSVTTFLESGLWNSSFGHFRL